MAGYFAFLSPPPLGVGLGATCTVHLRLKKLVDFIFVLTELFARFHYGFVTAD